MEIIEKKEKSLTIGVSDGFKLKHILELLNKTEVKQIFFDAFPSIKNITATAKSKESIFEGYIERQERIREEKRYAMTKEILADKNFRLFRQMIPAQFHSLTLEEELSNESK